MRLYFKKNVNEDKPKRWYVFDHLPEEYSSPRHFPNYEFDEYSILKLLQENNFQLSKQKNNFYMGRTKCTSWLLYLYFRSHAEEARFIMWASNGVEI